MRVVSFEQFRPSPRFDSLPFTKATIEESTSADGPWTTIDTINFSDPDTDPSDPKVRNFTTTQATLDAGWYKVTFIDALGRQSLEAEPLFDGPSPFGYAPSVSDVAEYILDRTIDKYGNRLGTFTSETTPTDVEVASLIDEGINRVADVIGDEIPESLNDDARQIAAERTAMLIELAFFSDQVNTGRSIYPQLKDMYDEDLLRLQQAIIAAGGVPVVDPAGLGMPHYYFLPPDNYDTRRW